MADTMSARLDPAEGYKKLRDMAEMIQRDKPFGCSAHISANGHIHMSFGLPLEYQGMLRTTLEPKS